MKLEDYLFVILAIFITSSLFKDNDTPELTVYFASCADGEHSIYDCPTYLHTIDMTYKALIREQKVVRKGAYFQPDPSETCLVYDEKNWVCSNNKGAFMTMRDGEHYEKNATPVSKGKHAGPLMPVVHQISRFHYWRLQF